MNKKHIHDFSSDLWNFIPHYHRFMHKFYHKKSDFSLNKNKKQALMIIYHHGEMCMSHLGECINLQKGSLTTLVDSLENNGFIKRNYIANDRRKIILSITEKSRELIAKRQKDMEEYIYEIFKNISDDEILILNNSIKNITKIFKKI